VIDINIDIVTYVDVCSAGALSWASVWSSDWSDRW